MAVRERRIANAGDGIAIDGGGDHQFAGGGGVAIRDGNLAT